MLGVVVSLNCNLGCLIDLKDMIWPLSKVKFELLEDDWLLETLQQVSNLLLLLANAILMLNLLMLKVGELHVEISLELEDNLF